MYILICIIILFVQIESLGKISDNQNMLVFSPAVYRSAQEEKLFFFAFTPQTKILIRELSRRNLRETSRKLAQTLNQR